MEFGLLPSYGSEEAEIDLHAATVYASVKNITADVSYCFEYESKSDELMEAEFTFPLDSDAAVYHFEAKIGERILIAKCRERIEAQETYKAAVEKGHAAFLVHENFSMADTFEMRIGNIPPHSKVTITLRYFHQLTTRGITQNEERYKDMDVCSVSVFSLPIVLKPRYMPSGTETISEFSVPPTNVVSSSQPYKFDFTANISTSSPLLSICSPRDSLSVAYGSGDKTSAVVHLSNQFTADHDLEMELALADPHAILVALEPGCTRVDGQGDDANDFLGVDCIVANILPKVMPLPDAVSDAGARREIIFLIDRSGSMDGPNIQQAKRALFLFLKSLPEGCRFQIIGFGSHSDALFPEPSDYTEARLAAGLNYCKHLEADFGGTEVLPALNRVYDVPLTGVGWTRHVIFLTDGDVFNQKEILTLVRSHTSTTSLFAIGLGHGASTSLIHGLARAGNGKAAIVRDEENLAVSVMDILNCTLQPQARDVVVDWDVKDCDGGALQVLTVPAQLPIIFADTYVTVAGLVANPKRRSPLRGNIRLSFTLQNQRHTFTGKLPTAAAADQQEDPFLRHLLHRQAAKMQIIELEDQCVESDCNLKPKIISLSVATNVLSAYTAFISVDSQNQQLIQSTQPRLQLHYSAAPVFGTAYDCMDLRADICFEACACSSSDTEKSTEPDLDLEVKDRAGIFAAKSQTNEALNEIDFSADIVTHVASLQQFCGCWQMDSELSSLLGASSTESLLSKRPSKFASFEESVWATAVVIAYLAAKCADRSVEWQLMVKKARLWLSKVVDQGLVDEAISEALLALASI